MDFNFYKVDRWLNYLILMKMYNYDKFFKIKD